MFSSPTTLARIAIVAFTLLAALAWLTWSFLSSSPVSASAPQIILPLRSFLPHRETWPKYQRLIIVPGHAIQQCTEQGKSVLDPSCWLLMQSVQKRQVPLFVAHVQRALRELAADDGALLVMSGGKTHAGVSRLSEASSLVALAERLVVDEIGSLQQLQRQPQTDSPRDAAADLLLRVHAEEFALDSHDNVIFSVCRFRQLTGHLPRRVTVVGFPFKQRRFTEIHRASAGIAAADFDYIAVDARRDAELARALGGAQEVARQSAIVDSAYPAFLADPYGCADALRRKRHARNMYSPFAPSAHAHMYAHACPELSARLLKCEPKGAGAQVPVAAAH